MTAMLNRGNNELIQSTLAALDLQPDDLYLDAGFGGGGALMLAARTVRTGHMYGIDFSPDVVVAAHRRMRSLVADGRLDLMTADLSDLPLRDGLVNKVSTMNTIYFWPKPETAMASLHRVIASGGRLAIGFAGPSKMTTYGKVTARGFSLYEPDAVASLMAEAGFESVSTVALSGRRTAGEYVTSGIRRV